MRAASPGNEGVSIGRRTGGTASADAAAGTGDVFDDDWLTSDSLIRSAMMRPTRSVPPPAENGTSIVIGFVG